MRRLEGRHFGEIRYPKISIVIHQLNALAMLATLDTGDLSVVRELEQLRIEATRRNDADVLAPLLDAQLIYVNTAREVFDKDHYLRNIRTRSLSYDRDFDVLETEVPMLGDVIILVGVMLGARGLDGEQAFHFPCIGVWRKDSGHWRMLAIAGQHDILEAALQR